jgi:hypothetical protein
MLLALASAAQAPPSSTSTQPPGKRLSVNAGIQTVLLMEVFKAPTVKTDENLPLF